MDPRADEPLLVATALALAELELTPTAFEDDEEDELVDDDDDELVDDDEVTLAAAAAALLGTEPRAGKGPG